MSEQKPKKDIWERIQALGPLIVAVAVSVIGGWYNVQQREIEESNNRSKVFTELTAQRENADSSLRAKMFETLFRAYFGGDIGASSHIGASGATPTRTDIVYATFSDPSYNVPLVRNQIMFLNLLSRNFETIDIKPLYEDLDVSLSGIIHDVNRSIEVRGKAFQQREKLRKSARNLAGRQARALASLEQAKTQRITVKSKKCTNPEITINNSSEINVRVSATKIKDGEVKLVIDVEDEESNETGDKPPAEPFGVSFFDMPYIDNSRLTNKKRLAAVLESYYSYDYAQFADVVVDNPALSEIANYLDINDCERQATVLLLWFPEDYLGLRDRPYLEDLIQRVLDDKPRS